MNRTVWSPASHLTEALHICRVNTGEVNFTHWVNSASFTEKLQSLSWNPALRSHIQTQGCNTHKGRVPKWTPSFVLFCKAFSLSPSLKLSKQARRKKMFASHSDMFKAKGPAGLLKPNTNNHHQCPSTRWTLGDALGT